MKRKMGTFISAGCVALLVCGAQAGVHAATATTRAAAITVSMFGSEPPGLTNVDTNWATQYAESHFNLRIHWISGLYTTMGPKLSVQLASGDYPDIIWNGGISTAQEEKYGHQGIIVPLNKYIKQYAPNVAQAMRDTPGLTEQMQAPDGTIWGIPTTNFCDFCWFSNQLWINTAWLKALHLKMPTTTAELYTVLEAFNTRHPLGVKNVIPLAGAVDGFGSDPTNYLMDPFIYNDGGSHFVVQNGKVSFAAIQPQWRQGLAYMHTLYAAGLINADTITQKQEQLTREVAQGNVGAVTNGLSANFLANYGAASSHWKDWQVVPPLKGPQGTDYATFNPPGGGVNFFITNKATPDQIRAVMKLANFAYSIQGSNTLNFGPEGKYWGPAKPGQKGADGKPALYWVDNTEFSGATTQNWGWNQMGPFNQGKEWRLGQAAPPASTPEGYLTAAHNVTVKYYLGHQPKQVYPSTLWIPLSQQQQYNLLQTNINSFVSQWTDQFIVGTKDLTKDWTTYVQGVQNLGLQQYIQLSQQSMGKPFDTAPYSKPSFDSR